MLGNLKNAYRCGILCSLALQTNQTKVFSLSILHPCDSQRLYGTSFFLVIFHKLVSEGHFLKPFGAMAVVKSIFRQHCITLIILLHIFLQAKQHIFPLSCCNEYPRY